VSVLTVQEPAERRCSPRRFSLRTGGTGTFGVCGCGDCSLDLRLAATSSVHFMGEIAVGRHEWLIANLSDDISITVADVDESAEPTVVWPGEWQPFSHDMAIVKPLAEAQAPSVTVFFTPGGTGGGTGQGGCPAIGRRLDPTLDPDARYFAVLAALCAPVLWGGPEAPVPTSAEIAVRLGLSPRAVDSHIDYLVDKFGIPVPASRSNGWKRRALTTHVRARESLARTLRQAAPRPTATTGNHVRKGLLCRTPI